MATIVNAKRAPLFALLDELKISYKTVDHEAVFTVDEGRDMKASMPGGHSKNLFLKDKKGKFFLVIAHADTQVDLIGLGKVIGAKGRLSFGKAEMMEEILGVSPGSVTPFAIMNDSDHGITNVVVDKVLLAHDPVWFHPLENTASTAISTDGLMGFLKACGHDGLVVDLANPQSGHVS